MCNNTNKKVLFKNCAPYTDCISEINNTRVDDAKDIDVVMPMYILVEYSDNYFRFFTRNCENIAILYFFNIK